MTVNLLSYESEYDEEIIITHKYRVVLLAFIVLLHIIARNIIGIASPDLVVLLTCFFAFSMLDLSEILIFYCFLIPYKTGIGMHAITLVFCVFYLLRKCRKAGLQVKKEVLLLLIITILEFINSTLGSANYAEWMRFCVYVIWLGIMYEILTVYEWNASLIAIMIKAFLVSFVVASIIVIYVNSNNTSFLEVVSGVTRIGKTSSFSNLGDMLISFHVNDLAVFCTCAISFTLVLLQQHFLKYQVGFPMIGFFLFVGILTQSRMFIVSVIAMALMIIFLQKKGKLKILIPMVVIVFIIYYLYLLGYLPVIDEILVRFNSTDMATGNGRTDIINIYNDLMANNPLRTIIGFGVIDYSSYTVTEAAHNGTQEMVLGIGIIGSICLISWFVYLINSAQRNTGKRIINNLFNYIPLVALILSMQFTQFISQYHMLLLLALSSALVGLTDRFE